MGPHMHPEVVVSAVPMGLSMPAWEADDFVGVRPHLERGVEVVAAAGADFFVCPDNTAHLVLEEIIDDLPLPGIHIAHAVCKEIVDNGWKRVGLLGTRWTMTGRVYEKAFEERGLERLIPDAPAREMINTAIFDELCQGRFLPGTTRGFISAIEQLKAAGAQCVVLGCTEIPLIINEGNSPLPVLDSTRLLAKYAVGEAIDGFSARDSRGWIGL